MSSQKKMKPTVTTPSPLRRSERNRNNVSSSSSSTMNHSPSNSKRHVLVKELNNIDEEKVKEISLNRKLRKRDARKDCHKETINEDEDRSNPDDSNVGEAKIDEPSKGDSLHCKEVFEACTRNKKGKSGDSVEKPQGNNAETEKIRKQQRSLHLSLKPEIAKLCEILLLPENVKSAAGKFLEYTMNNYKICTEPVSILQAFQLSVCWTAASLQNHKFDTEASLILAKRHLNFDCKKDAVDEINELLWDLKDKFSLLTENSDVNCSPEASVSSSRVHSNTDITTDVVMTKKDISRNIKVSQHRDQWRELLRMQKENELKLKKDLKTEIDDFKRQRNIEWVCIIKPIMNEKNEEETIKDFRSEYNKGIAELKSQYNVRLKAFMTEHLKAQKKFRESLSPDELSNLVISSKEHETPHNAS